MASKRKRSVMSLEKKLDIITQRRQGRSQRAVADGFGVAKATVGDIWKNREKIEIHVSASTNPAFAKKRCIVRDAHFHKLDEACYIWFQQQRAKGAPVSGPLLQEKALQLFPSLYPDEDESAFKASSGWLHKFCRRHGVRELSLQGEALSADTSAVEPFCQQLKNKIEEEGYSRCQIFNADETGLWWRLMPSKSLVDSGEKQARNFKKPKDRVTVLGCANASGTCKVPLAFIHIHIFQASHLINVANICTMHAIYGFSELRTFLTYGHPSVPCCPDKGGLTVHSSYRKSAVEHDGGV